jgi:Na+/melibiose symporter-like transporter
MNPDALGDAGRDRRSGPVNPVAKRLALLLPMIFVPAHAVVALASHDPNASATLIFETMAPLIAGIACIWRASLGRGRARHGWLAVGVAMPMIGIIATAMIIIALPDVSAQRRAARRANPALDSCRLIMPHSVPMRWAEPTSSCSLATK